LSRAKWIVKITMYDLVFKHISGVALVRVNEKSISFSTMDKGQFSLQPIENIKLDVDGILREFPDLKEKTAMEIRKEAIQRFKDHINKMETEMEIVQYVVKDLSKHGYEFVNARRPGFRGTNKLSEV
jgi:hypothetical protein